jgi:anthranilate phosphoribosyltransferase
MNNFIDFLKQKGTGKNMGKSLHKEDLDQLEPMFLDESIPTARKATLLTALLMLPPNEDEEIWIYKIKKDPSIFFPKELLFLFSDPKTAFEQLIHRLLNHENLSSEEMKEGMNAVCDSTTPDSQKAAFLEGERLKRETLIENTACYEYLYDHSAHIITNKDVIVDIANPYDGFNRFPNLMLFVAPILAALDIPVVLHGTYEVSPKKGITLHKLLKEAKKSVSLSLEDATKQLQDNGWTYIDQPKFSLKMDKLVKLRTLMVKRPLLSTLEKFLSPIQGKEGNILITGYTHPPYKAMTENILKSMNHISGYIILRGMEGSTQLPPDRKAPFLSMINNQINEEFVSLEDVDLSLYKRLEANYELSTKETLQLGEDALQNKHGLALDIISYNAAFIYSQIKMIPINSAMNVILETIKNKSAYRKWIARSPNNTK